MTKNPAGRNVIPAGGVFDLEMVLSFLLHVTYELVLVQNLDVFDKPWNQRLGFFAELCGYKLGYLMYIACAVHLLPDVAPISVERYMADAGTFENLLRKPVVKAFVHHMDGDNAFLVCIPGVLRVADRNEIHEIFFRFAHRFALTFRFL